MDLLFVLILALYHVGFDEEPKPPGSDLGREGLNGGYVDEETLFEWKRKINMLIRYCTSRLDGSWTVNARGEEGLTRM